MFYIDYKTAITWLEYINIWLDDYTLKDLKESLEEALGLLNDRERDILCLRNGLIDDTEWSLEKIGNKYNISRERVRQIVNKAIRKIKNSRCFDKIASFNQAEA